MTQDKTTYNREQAIKRYQKHDALFSAAAVEASHYHVYVHQRRDAVEEGTAERARLMDAVANAHLAMARHWKERARQLGASDDELERVA